jgi:hypothetical protein
MLLYSMSLSRALSYAAFIACSEWCRRVERPRAFRHAALHGRVRDVIASEDQRAGYFVTESVASLSGWHTA